MLFTVKWLCPHCDDDKSRASQNSTSFEEKVPSRYNIQEDNSILYFVTAKEMRLHSAHNTEAVVSRLERDVAYLTLMDAPLDPQEKLEENALSFMNTQTGGLGVIRKQAKQLMRNKPVFGLHIVSALHVYLVPLDVKKRVLDTLKLKLQIVVSQHNHIKLVEHTFKPRTQDVKAEEPEVQDHCHATSKSSTSKSLG
ncbi:hypothetical protein STEG23_033733, partial [Scotinomys teguina]